MKKIFKEMIRGIEGFTEVFILSFVYYLSFRFMYSNDLFPAYYGRGKYLLIGVYALITYIFFSLNDGFMYGRLKLSHIYITQTIDILMVNVITYFQLCLIANKMISILPTIYLFFIDLVICLILCYLYTSIYHKTNMPRKMIMVYGNDSALSLMNKMNSEEYRHRVASAISTECGFDGIVAAINK